MSKSTRRPNVERAVLDSLIGREVTVFLTNRTALRGVLVSHDTQTIRLQKAVADEEPSLVYKQHISTIQSGSAPPRNKKK